MQTEPKKMQPPDSKPGEGNAAAADTAIKPAATPPETLCRDAVKQNAGKRRLSLAEAMVYWVHSRM